MQFSKDILRTKSRVRKQNEAVKPQIRRLSNDLKSITTLPGDNGLGRLLADLLQYGISPLRIQRSDIGGSGISALSRFESIGKATEDARIDQVLFPFEPV